MPAANAFCFWAASAGDWVRRGDRLFTLVRAAAPDLLVEALVPLRALTGIREHDTASIALPRAGELIEARVALLALDSERQLRAGFPSLANVLLRPSPAMFSQLIGVLIKWYSRDVPETMLIVAGLRRRLSGLAPTVLAALGLGRHAIAREPP